MKILVRNLSRDTTQNELLELFKASGNVQYCTVVMDKETGKSKGFAFVEMPHAGEAKVAIKTLNAQEVGGSKIRVKKAEASEGKAGDWISSLRGPRWLGGSGGMSDTQANNPLHGVTLEMMLVRLVERYGWEELGRMINIKCFKQDPSIKSSLKFLRRTPWAREKVERLYLRSPPAGGG